MKTNIGKFSMITLGLVATGMLAAGAYDLWARLSDSYLGHGMFQTRGMMIYGSNPWGLWLAIGALLLIVIGVISMLKNEPTKNTQGVVKCTKCGENLTDHEWEFCPFCGDTA